MTHSLHKNKKKGKEHPRSSIPLAFWDFGMGREGRGQRGVDDEKRHNQKAITAKLPNCLPTRKKMRFVKVS